MTGDANDTENELSTCVGLEVEKAFYRTILFEMLQHSSSKLPNGFLFTFFKRINHPKHLNV